MREVTKFSELVEFAEGVYEEACESVVEWNEGLGSYVLLIQGTADAVACAPLGLIGEDEGEAVVRRLRPMLGGRTTGAILYAALPEGAKFSGRDARRIIVLLRTRDGGRWMRQSVYARLDDGIVRTGEWADDVRGAPGWIRTYWEAELF